MSERTLPLSDHADLSTVTILSDGNEITPEYQVLTIVVNHAVNRIPTAKLILVDGDVSTQDFPVSNTDDFAPGKEIEIQAGYHNNEETIFKGVVLRHGLKSKDKRGSLLTVVCKDPAAKMTVGRRSAYRYEVTDSDVLEEIISAHGLTADVESMSLTHKEMVQYQATDWDFLVSRAEVNGKLVFVKDGEVGVRAPDPSQDPALTLIYGATLIEFEAELDAEKQWPGVTTASWSMANQEPVEVAGADPGFTEQGNIPAADLSQLLELDDYRLHHGAALADGELQAWSDGILARSRLAKIQGRARSQGIASVSVGDVIAFEGVGERFNGNAFVSAIRHEITPGNWVTDFQTGLRADWFHQKPDVQVPAAGGLVPAIPGLHVGKVTKLQEDPDGENRIQVRLPLISAEGEGVWCRVSTLDAGEARGTFFLPEIDDEVVVGFLYGDPRQPIVLGMLHSSAKPAPLEASDDNHEKGYVSRSEIRLVFNDEKTVVTLETPGGRVVTLDDDAGEIVLKDGDGNSATISGDGIVLESAADIKLTASGDIKLEGTNVEATANANFKADGSAGTDVTSSAITTIKGSLVQIN